MHAKLIQLGSPSQLRDVTPAPFDAAAAKDAWRARKTSGAGGLAFLDHGQGAILYHVFLATGHPEATQFEQDLAGGDAVFLLSAQGGRSGDRAFADLPRQLIFEE